MSAPFLVIELRSVNGAGEQASKTLKPDGVVHGAHASFTVHGPFIHESSTPLSDQAFTTICDAVTHLPDTPTPVHPDAQLTLTITRHDHTTLHFHTTAAASLTNPYAQTIRDILEATQAGGW